jgi:hypothetical protein
MVSTSTYRTFTINNYVSEPLVLGTISLSGANTSEFSLFNDQCSGMKLYPGNSCTFQATFAPTSVGAKGVQVNIPSNDPDTTTLHIQLTGTATSTVETLNLTLNGTGNGTVTINPPGIATNVNYSGIFDTGTSLTLHPQPVEYSLFYGWSSSCTNKTGDCGITMNTGKNVTATFDKDTAHVARIDLPAITYFTTLLAAYTAAQPSAVIKAWGTSFTGPLTLGLSKAVTIKGGYNEGYSTNGGYTTLQGSLTVKNGALTVERLVIR